MIFSIVAPTSPPWAIVFTNMISSESFHVNYNFPNLLLLKKTILKDFSDINAYKTIFLFWLHPSSGGVGGGALLYEI
jgi:hypothetical protein